MKISPNTSPIVVFLLGLAGAVGLMLAHAQETVATTTTPSADSIVALAADSQSLPLVSLANVPVRGGTFWWVYPDGLAVPTPVLPLDFTAPIYGISSQAFLVDLTGGNVLVTRRQLAAESGTANPYAAAVTAQVQGLIDLVTTIQTPAPLVAGKAALLRVSPMFGGGGGFTPDFQIQSGIPYLTIVQTNGGSFWLTVWNNQSPANYAIWWTPVLENTDYPWQTIAAGTTGQTNFVVSVSPFATGFFEAEWDTNAVPSWVRSNPNDPNSPALAVFIDSPTNGAVIQ